MKCLVTGGGGFVGRALVLRLLSLGHEVKSISRGKYPELESAGASALSMDLSCPPPGLEEFIAGVETVFHVAAKVDMWGDYAGFYATNVIGTNNLLRLSQEAGVKYFVYTSSPSVVADGSDLCGIDESYPYPARYLAHYPATKAIAEREVLMSNREGFWTCALRPHLIWGPGDRHLIPTILDRARKARLVRVGNGLNKTDVCFIEDCVEAHICAMRALEVNPASRGRAYFISQGEPVLLWNWIDEILRRNNLPPIKRSVPRAFAYALGSMFEFVSLVHPQHPEPVFTRFLAEEMATSHYFDISRARNLLGYEPQYSVEAALDKTFG